MRDRVCVKVGTNGDVDSKSRLLAAKHLEVVKSTQFNRSFIRECAILCECRHEHVLEFVGISYGKVDNALVLVTEFCPHTLKGLVFGDGALKYSEVLYMAHEVACGMAYLHTKKVAFDWTESDTGCSLIGHGERSYTECSLIGQKICVMNPIQDRPTGMHQ